MGLGSPTSTGAKAPAALLGLGAALKRRSSTVLRASDFRSLWGLRRDRSRALPGRGVAESSEGFGRGIPLFAKCAKNGAPSGRDGVGEQQVPRLRKIVRFADDLSPLGMTRVSWELVALLKSRPDTNLRPSSQR